MRSAKIWKILKLLYIFLLGEIGLCAMVFLNWRGLGWVWSLVMIPYAFVLYLPLRQTRKLVLLAALFSPLEKFIAYNKEYKQNLDLANDFLGILRGYGLTFDQDYSQKLVESIPATAPNVLDYYADKVVQDLGLNPPAVYKEILLLLYEESKRATLSRWRTHKNVCARELALVLLKSGQLPIRPPNFLDGEELAQLLLLELEEFSLISVRELVENLSSTCSETGTYLTFLSEQGVASATQGIRPRDILRFVAGNQLSLKSSSLDSTCYKVLVGIGRKYLGEIFSGHAASSLDSYSLISLTIFLDAHVSEKQHWESQACREAAKKKEAALIVLAYLQFSKEAAVRGDGKKSTRLKDVFENWQDKISDLGDLGDGLQKEIRRITYHLKKGGFPETLRLHIDDTLKYLAQTSSIGPGLRDALQKRPWLRQALNKVVTKLRPATIRRFLEARTVSPYFITFESRLGEIAELLDDLVSLDKREQLKHLDIELEAEGQPKYNFKQYTKNVRIGVVPRSTLFKKFCEEFDHDFNKLVAAKRPDSILKNWELIIHQFDLSPQNFFGFVLPNVTRDRAIQRLTELFGDILNPDELLAMIEYQGDVSLKQIMMEAKISEVIGDLEGLSPQERDAIKKHDSDLANVIMKIVGVENTTNLGLRVLGLKKAEREHVAMLVGREIGPLLATDLPSFNETRCWEVATTYLETLAVIATI